MLVHIVLLRTDLGWPVGALATQAVHASNACLFSNLTNRDEKTKTQIQSFLESGSKMNVLLKEIPSLSQMQELQEKLKETQIEYEVWVEEPENVAVAIAIVPTERSIVMPLVKRYPLFCCSNNK